MKQSYKVVTIAGNGRGGFENGNALEASFDSPNSIDCSNDGTLYVYDLSNFSIRTVSGDQVKEIAGFGKEGFKDGHVREAMFNGPMAICCSNDGKIYLSDENNHRIRMFYNDYVTTIAGNGKQGSQDGNALEAMFSLPMGICCSNDGILYVTDSNNHRIRTVYNDKVTTIAGNGKRGYKDGNALEAMFNRPAGVCCSNDGRIFLNDQNNHRIRMIYKNTVTTIAGNSKQGFKDGKALEAMFNYPGEMCCSNDGKIYIADNFNHRIRMIYNSRVTTIAGNGQEGFKDGNALEAMFNYPMGICCSKDGKLYVADQYNDRIRMIYNDQFQSPFGFAHLLDMKNTFCDSQISFNNVNYHLHSVLVNLRCPLLFDQSYFTLIQQSNISNESFEAFVIFLYSNKLTQEYNEKWPTTMSIKTVIELIFTFDLLMNCKWILTDLKIKFEEQLIEMLKINQQQSMRQLIGDLLPLIYNLKEIIKAMQIKSNITNTSYTQYCYNRLVDELQKKRSVVEQHIELLDSSKSEIISIILNDDISGAGHTEIIDDQSMISSKDELLELSKLSFEKTNICKMENNETKLESSISTHHLDAWTHPDFVIKLCNDDITYHVHMLILCGRWKYFCLMIESGMKEVVDNIMTLSEDWNRSRFEKFMKYIYLNEIEFDELEDVEWLMEYRKLYGITFEKLQKQERENKSNTGATYGPNHGNIETYRSEKNEFEEIAAYGFESLYDHCTARFSQK